MKLHVLEVNFRIDGMRFNKQLLWERKIRWYTMPMKVLYLSSIDKQKSMLWHSNKKVGEYKETYTIYK